MQERGRAAPVAVLLEQPEADTRAEEPVTVRLDGAADLDEAEAVDLTVAAVAVEVEAGSTRAATLLLRPLISLLLPAAILEGAARINHDLFCVLFFSPSSLYPLKKRLPGLISLSLS